MFWFFFLNGGGKIYNNINLLLVMHLVYLS